MALQFNLVLSHHLSNLNPVSKSNPLPPSLSNPNPLSRFSFPRRPIRGFRVNERHGIALKRHRVACAAEIVDGDQGGVVVKGRSVSVILLAGGKGKRMGVSMPKQYLPLLGQPIALYSFNTFCEMNEVKEIIVVCDPSYKDVFEDANDKITIDLKFALPGKERQDSVFNGLQEIDGSSELVCIHDSARPLVSSYDIGKVLKDGWLHGAAVLGVPVKATIKEADNKSFVVKTLNRKTLWEMQTPQVMKPELLRKGFELVNRNQLEVTDDVSIVEHLKHPVYITEGSYTNIKPVKGVETWKFMGILQVIWTSNFCRHPSFFITTTTFAELSYLLHPPWQVTTPDDLLLAERILNTEVGVPS